jgi:hypothetical protein
VQVVLAPPGEASPTPSFGAHMWFRRPVSDSGQVEERGDGRGRVGGLTGDLGSQIAPSTNRTVDVLPLSKKECHSRNFRTDY